MSFKTLTVHLDVRFPAAGTSPCRTATPGRSVRRHVHVGRSHRAGRLEGNAGGGQRAARRSAFAAPREAGSALMPLGFYSLDARIQLARRSRHSLDVQFAEDHHPR
jgi:hypothetical protein